MTGSQRNEAYGHTPWNLGLLYYNDLRDATFSLRTHYRIVFKEVCQPLHCIGNLHEVFSMLCQAAEG